MDNVLFIPASIGISGWTERIVVPGQQTVETVGGGMATIDGGVHKRSGTVTLATDDEAEDRLLYHFHNELRGNNNIVGFNPTDDAMEQNTSGRVYNVSAIDSSHKIVTLVDIESNIQKGLLFPAFDNIYLFTERYYQKVTSFGANKTLTFESALPAEIKVDSEVYIYRMIVHLLAEGVEFVLQGNRPPQEITYPWREV